MRRLLLLIALVFLFGCGRGIVDEINSTSPEVDFVSKRSEMGKSPIVEVSIVFQRQLGMSSNQFAVWIEDAFGSHVKTLYTTRWTAEGGWKIWEVLLPEWKKAAQPQKMSPETINAISGATPLSGTFSYSWNCRDENDIIVPAGEYRYIVEGNLRWASRVLYTGKIGIGGNAQQSQGRSEYFGDDEHEREMITRVTVKYHP